MKAQPPPGMEREASPCFGSCVPCRDEKGGPKKTKPNRDAAYPFVRP